MAKRQTDKHNRETEPHRYVPGIWHVGLISFCFWYLVSGNWQLAIGNWYLVFGNGKDTLVFVLTLRVALSIFSGHVMVALI